MDLNRLTAKVEEDIAITMNWKTGTVRWKRKDGEGDGKGSASVTYADGRLYIHYQNGVVALAETSPAGYKEVGSFRAPK